MSWLSGDMVDKLVTFDDITLNTSSDKLGDMVGLSGDIGLECPGGAGFGL